MSDRLVDDAALRPEGTGLPHGGPEELFAISTAPVEDGLTAGSLRTGSWLCGDDGHPLSGALAVLLDDVVGQAAFAFRPAGHWAVTTELSIDFLAPLPTDGTPVTARGRHLLGDDAGGAADGDVTDAHGVRYAVATTRTCYVPGVPHDAIDPPPVPPIADRDRPLPELLGLPADPEPVVLRPTQLVANVNGVVHGGVVACVGEIVARRALGTPWLRTASLRTLYLRPAAGAITFEPEVVHAGRSLAVVVVTARNEAGKPVATITVACRSTGAAPGRG
ncbi:hotdog domain-containing protein [Pseudonocardia sediminis]|nr:hotdog domain-containing protein [Pseudonocardia sediminis]